jgi:hypothetical protein
VDSRWAIEYEQPAADAFKLNHPAAAVFSNNCNVILLVRPLQSQQLSILVDTRVLHKSTALMY